MNVKLGCLLAGFILFILIAVLYTYPLAFNLSIMFPGQGQSDTPLSIWNIWHFKKSISAGLNLFSFTTDYIFWPQRPSLILHNYTLTTGLLSLPLQFFFAPIVSRNLLLFLQFALTGMGMYCLILFFTRNSTAALWAGITLAFCPYVIIRSYHYLNLSTIWYFPWFVCLLWRFLDRGKLKFASGAAIVYALCLWDDQTYFVFLTLLMLFMVGFSIITRNKWSRTHTGNSLLGILIFLALTFPYLTGLRRILIAAENQLHIWDNNCIAYFSLHAQNLFLPSTLLSVYRKISCFPLRMEHVTNVFAGYLPLFFALLALLNLRKFSAEKRKIIYFWLVTGLCFFLIALGPLCFGKNQPINRFSPYNLLCSGILRQIRIPVRFSLVTLIAIYIIGAFGVERLLKINKGKLINNLSLGVFLVTLQVIEFLPIPYPLLNLKVPAVYYQLANDDQSSVLLVLPLGWQSSYKTVGIFDRRIQFYQTVHNHPIFQGQIARIEDKYFDYYLSQPGFKYLISAHEKKPNSKDKAAVYAVLKKYGIKNTVIHTAYFDREHLDALLKLFRDYPGKNEVTLVP